MLLLLSGWLLLLLLVDVLSEWGMEKFFIVALEVFFFVPRWMFRSWFLADYLREILVIFLLHSSSHVHICIALRWSRRFGFSRRPRFLKSSRAIRLWQYSGSSVGFPWESWLEFLHRLSFMTRKYVWLILSSFLSRWAFLFQTSFTAFGVRLFLDRKFVDMSWVGGAQILRWIRLTYLVSVWRLSLIWDIRNNVSKIINLCLQAFCFRLLNFKISSRCLKFLRNVYDTKISFSPLILLLI